MSEHIYKKIEVVGSSSVGIEDAINRAIAKASESLKNLRWFEVAEIRGNIDHSKVAHWQVTVKIGFTIED